MVMHVEAFSNQTGSVFHKMWTEQEASMSSTWWELKSIELFLLSSVNDFKGKSVKCFTGNKSCVYIAASGSTKPH